MRSKAARNAAFACSAPSAYNLMRTSVPMCGSTASNNCRSAAAAFPKKPRHAAARKPRDLLLIVFQAAVPIQIHLRNTGDLRLTNQAETQPLGVRQVPDALRQLRVLLLPGRVGGNPRGAAQHVSRVVPPSAPHGVRIWLGGFGPRIGRQ